MLFRADKSMVCLFSLQSEMEKGKEMDMVKVDTNQTSNGCSITNKAWNSLLSAVKSVLKWLHIGMDWLKDTNSDAFARRTVTASDSICSADGVSLRFLIMLFKLKSRREL